MDEAVQRYIDAIAPEIRPLFDRLHQLILAALRPEDAAGLPDDEILDLVHTALGA